MTFKRALVSVSDKTGLADFLKALSSKSNLEIVSTGGTSKHLKQAGLKVIDVEEITGFPEILDGRVKTLHPKIHASILAREWVSDDQKVLKDMKLEPFDLVIVNLYPFAEALKEGLNEKELIEYVDIGGPTLLRAAAKNYFSITTVCDPSDYQRIIAENGGGESLRKQLAAKVFSHVSAYDRMIADKLQGEASDKFQVTLQSKQKLRYGENPHQNATWFLDPTAKEGLHRAQIIQGKELSYNNILDLHSAVSTLREFPERLAAVAVKHNSPCGIASGTKPLDVVEKVLAADPVSVFGGIIALSFPVDAATAEKLTGLFLECVVAPKVDEAAREVFKKKANLRILEWPGIMTAQSGYQFRSVDGGALVQDKDAVSKRWESNWAVHGAANIPDDIKEDLLTAWKACAHLKSNAIAVVSRGQSVGLGMGQVNRVDAVEQAILRMQKNHPKATTPVLASDAFFPFTDSIDKIFEAGIRWIIQPGGSVKDSDVLARAKELGVNVVLTGQRHFVH